ncbi:invasion associated locus B family protein [Rhizobium sp. P38BS-XIX]|uniref:invasion associated locus B family protein n=1 Tax=Rhizobium sp. P38BS-XIX TaxID=2726740 RepID=UPI001457138E|nr:invasion associated locus B family protein [Rhizobium sp. P38BS-XIX]NLR97631.1 invasion associated locus B family protein [Rhizobium sp. P38BS-XIX]
MTDQIINEPTIRLPGGADALREVHGDWLVVGSVQANVSASQKSCVIVQEQIHNETRQRVLLVELRPEAGKVTGTLVLPFGLLFQKGVVLQVDEGSRAPAIPFRTALPVGCIVDLDIDALRLSLIKSGKTLHIHAIAADTAQIVTFPVSLNGFASALARAETVLG